MTATTAASYARVATADQVAPSGPLLVPYYRVSTKMQKVSGLGLEGQDIDVERHRARVGGVLDGEEFVEIETGTKKRTRPVLRKALAKCQRTGATLVIAKLDRLSRNVHFISGLMEANVPFVCCDNPEATPLILHVLAAVAEHEAKATADRVRRALHAYKANGHVSKRIKALHPEGVPDDVREATAGKLGAALPQCRNLTDEFRRRGAEATARKAREAAILESRDVHPRIIAGRVAGKSYAAIAEELNEAGFLSRRKKAWTATPVRRVYERLILDRAPA